MCPIHYQFIQNYFLVQVISNLKEHLQIKDVADCHTLEKKKCQWFVMNAGEANQRGTQHAKAQASIPPHTNFSARILVRFDNSCFKGTPL